MNNAGATEATTKATATTGERGRGVPDGFRDHYFNVPLAARVVANGDIVGNAMIVLGTDDRVRILHFIGDAGDHLATRDILARALVSDTALGPCTSGRCSRPLEELAFDTRTSTLHIAFTAAMRENAQARRAEPAAGRGLIVNQRSSVVGNSHAMAATMAVDLMGSIGRWTTMTAARHSRAGDHAESSLQSAFGERELDGRFVRVGYFQPDATGLYRQPRIVLGQSLPILGAMVGSSDTLRGADGEASAYPVYVSTGRAAIVEIYRDGRLIHAQPVAAGLQPLDTRAWPQGIYPVELRVIQDGAAVSEQTQLVYKPGNWHDTSRPWRYNLYAGYDAAVDRWAAARKEGASIGASMNYLAHPRMVLGLGVGHHTGDRSATASLDVEAASWASAYANVHQGRAGDRGADIQWAMRRNGTSMIVGLGSYRRAGEHRRSGSIAAVHQIAHRSQVTVRSAYTGRPGERSHDIIVDRRWRVRGAQLISRLGAFDRPRSGRIDGRDRGIEWRWSLTFDSGRQTIGTTTAVSTRAAGGTQGGVDYQRRSDGTLSQVSGFLARDASGATAGVDAYVDTSMGNGSFFAQKLSDGGVSGGLNIQTHHALGDGFITSTAATQLRFAQAVMMVDVISDDAAARLYAHDERGNRHVLRPGRNVIELATFLPGVVTLDATGMHVDRRRIDYHVRKGGVVHVTIRVAATQAVLGQLLDEAARPVAGATMTSSAGQTVSDADGMFSLDIAPAAPTLDVFIQGRRRCTLQPSMPTERTVMHALGPLTCRPGQPPDGIPAKSPVSLNA